MRVARRTTTVGVPGRRWGCHCKPTADGQAVPRVGLTQTIEDVALSGITAVVDAITFFRQIIG